MNLEAMKKGILTLMIIIGFAGCGKSADLPEVTFEWFNLGTNQIWVTTVIGFPREASPGRLMPSRSEDQLDVTASVFSEVMNIGGRIVIKWRDNGPAGWPGGLKIPGSVPPGEAHEVEFKRNDLKIPDKLEKARVRLTYLGNDKWRIKLIEE